MITLKPSRLGALGEFVEPLGRAVRRDDALVVGDAELVEHLGGVPHGRPVRLAAHDDGDGFCRFAHARVLLQGKARGRTALAAASSDNVGGQLIFEIGQAVA